MAQKRQRHLRKRKASESEDPDAEAQAEDDHADSGTKVVDTKLQQRRRQRLTGTPADALMLQSRASDEGGQAVVASTGEPTDLLEAFLKEQVKDDGTLDPEMEKYIGEQMAKRLGRRSGMEDDQPGTGLHTEEDDLYNIPDHLKAQKTRQQDVSAWMTGIVEVPLPTAIKLRNIEETEAAKKQLLKDAAAQCA